MTELLYRPESEEELYALMPRFLKEDRNTRALIAAACHMVFRFLQAVEHAIVELTDIDRMSEEALDEKAYSLGMLWYDYQADVQKKRMWIAETEQMRRSIGTIAAIARLMTGAYAKCNVEEWPEYGGEPYHFRVTVFGSTDAKQEEWARKAIEHTKNLRSILDGFYYSSTTSGIVLEAESRAYEAGYRRAGEGQDALMGA